MNLLEVNKLLCARPLVLAAVSLAIGIITGKYLGIPIILCLCLLLGFVLYQFIKSRNETVKNGRLLLLFLVVLSFFFGLIRIRDTEYDIQEVIFPEKAIKNTVIEATLSDISLGREQYILILEDSRFNSNNGKIMVYTNSLEGACIGDIVRASGTLYAFSKATNYGQFDQREFYLARGITLKLYADELSLIKKNRSLYGLIRGSLFEMSESFQEGLGKAFDEKDTGILSAMLLGNRSELDDTTKGLYQRVGIAHILSISGLHITLIGMGLFNLFMLLTKRLKFSVISSVIIIFFYGILTGFSVSTIRACIMLASSLGARLLGKGYDGQSAAGLAGIIILSFSPLELFETGFQLSFAAVFGIFAGNEIRKNLKLKNKTMIYLIPAISAQIATFPLILRSYYSFSPYSIIANLILLPFMSVIVISGLIAGILGFAALSLGNGALLTMAEIAAGPPHFLLQGYEKTSETILNLPGADMITGCPGITKCIIYYLILFILVYISFVIRNIKAGSQNIKNMKKIKLGFFSAFLLALSFGIGLLIIRTGRNGLYSSFIDVGQGLSMYVEMDGKAMLFDGGSSNIKNVGKYRIQPFLLWRGVSELECCFVSHTDEDHISGIREIITEDRISIKNLIVGTNYSAEEPLVTLAKDKGINVMFLETGDILREIEGKISKIDLYNDQGMTVDDNFMISILSPDENFIYEDKNQASLVALVRHKNMSILFTGDSDIYAESEYVRNLADHIKVNVLQCPHHGSKYSCSELLLDTVNPDVTVISCSKTNNYGHPSPETLERIERADSDCFVTSKDGMITIRYRGDGSFDVNRYIS